MSWGCVTLLKRLLNLWPVQRPDLLQCCLAALLLGAWPASAARVDPGDCVTAQALDLGPSADLPALVIIIDDIGHRLDTGRDSAALPGRIALAILPFTPHGAELARTGYASGKEILLHAPMSSVGDQNAPEPDVLDTSFDELRFIGLLDRQLADVPHVRGVNNHMGSALTAQAGPMRWLMSELSRRNLYFVDSRTTAETVAATTARSFGVPHLSRRVFLDNTAEPSAIEERFEFAVAEARRNGYAVAIGHPYPETVAVLQRKLPELSARAVRLAWPSEWVNPAGYDRVSRR